MHCAPSFINLSKINRSIRLVLYEILEFVSHVLKLKIAFLPTFTFELIHDLLYFVKYLEISLGILFSLLLHFNAFSLLFLNSRQWCSRLEYETVW